MSEREWHFHLDDMTDFAQKVLAYTGGIDQHAFIASGLNYDAAVRYLELLGGAAPRTSRPNRGMSVLRCLGGRLSQPATG